jgi:hypothetical protein
MGHSTPNLHNPMTTRIHKPSPAERKVHSLVVQAHRRLPLLYPCAHCNRPNRLNLKQSRAGLPCDACITIN